VIHSVITDATVPASGAPRQTLSGVYRRIINHRAKIPEGHRTGLAGLRQSSRGKGKVSSLLTGPPRQNGPKLKSVSDERGEAAGPFRFPALEYLLLTPELQLASLYSLPCKVPMRGRRPARRRAPPEVIGLQPTGWRGFDLPARRCEAGMACTVACEPGQRRNE
jgi:hypothetical protein